MPEAVPYHAVIVGGGFYGCSLAVALARQGGRVLLCEQEPALLTRASYNNQARVHNGYHYPRSVLTAVRSRINFPRWVKDYHGCVVDDFEKYYAIARRFSKVSSRQFRSMMQRIDAPLEFAPRHISRLFDAALVEDVFTVREFAFDAVKLRGMMEAGLQEAGVELACDTRALRLAQKGDAIQVTMLRNGHETAVSATHVVNCTYSHINELLAASGLPLIRLKHELAEMALVEMPEELRNLGVTVMCGPFFSCMPFPARGLHTLSHVRYTPHGSWQETDEPCSELRDFLTHKRPLSHYPYMLADARRYLPALGDCRHVDSLWEIKTVLPQCEECDSRPILFKSDCGLKNLHCVMGAKIDNIFDALSECASLACAPAPHPLMTS
ncbi:MAG: dependent oxidoreductase [Verrucomicrobiaceae bacterium]|nr:dependent oxidoreductase [Verrucomicrobiaceae bacterium]